MKEKAPRCANSESRRSLDLIMSPLPMQPSPPIDWDQVMGLLDCLGKDPAETFLRAIKPPRGPGHIFRLDPSKAEGYVRDGWGLYFNVGNGGTCKAEISSVPAFWAEWDDRPKSAQIDLWQQLGLPEPSVQIDTAGKSIHTYWVLAYFGTAQIIEDLYSNGKSIKGDAEMIVFNFADIGVMHPELVVIGSA